jgi:type II secretory ATPase GspE/PulE/Tfp pilus assembly ATPase PilB-like protein
MPIGLTDEQEQKRTTAPITPRKHPGAAVVGELATSGPIAIIRLVETLIADAHEARASDIHLDPNAAGAAIRFRIDGMIEDVCQMPHGGHAEVVARLKILCGLRTDEHQSAQDGRFRATLPQAEGVDVRVSIVPTYFGENAVLRLLAGRVDDYTLELLQFTQVNREKILRSAQKPHGMILATGPTGSGKTTTLYTLVKMLSLPGTSVITIEDPIEYSIARVNQIQVNPRTGLTFANGLRSMLRQDPDVIMVGEIRDVETAQLAVNTALTGHLVLSTLHTNDAATTLPRLLDMRVEPYLIASTVNIAIAQRLVRKICQGCVVRRSMREIERKSLETLIRPQCLATLQDVFIGKGCDACAGSGYRGRVGIHEVMEIDQALRDAILGKASASALREIAIRSGMVPMLEDGLQKATEGLTTIEEVLRMRYE